MNENCLNKIYFLNEKSSFIKGVGSTLNIAGNYFSFNYSNSPNEADAKSIMSDWDFVGSDISEAKEKFEKENSLETCDK